MIEFFPEAKQQVVRSIMAGVLRGVISQRLLPRLGGGRIAVVEAMIVNARIADLIREGRPDEITDAIAEGEYFGMQTFQMALIEAVVAGSIDREVAANAASNRHDFLVALERELKLRAAQAKAEEENGRGRRRGARAPRRSRRPGCASPVRLRMSAGRALRSRVLSDERGITLIEMLIVCALLGIVLAGLTNVFVSGTRAVVPRQQQPRGAAERPDRAQQARVRGPLRLERDDPLQRRGRRVHAPDRLLARVAGTSAGASRAACSSDTSRAAAPGTGIPFAQNITSLDAVQPAGGHRRPARRCSVNLSANPTGRASSTFTADRRDHAPEQLPELNELTAQARLPRADRTAMNAAFAAVVFAPALAVGSFLNVIASRLPARAVDLRPRSKCPHCDEQIAARDNVPLALLPAPARPLPFLPRADQLALPGGRADGRCLVAACVVAFGLSLQALAAAIFCVGARHDLGDRPRAAHRPEPDRAAGGGCGARGCRRPRPEPRMAGRRSRRGALPLRRRLAYPRGMGMGDVKLALLLGVAVGWTVPVALMGGMVAALVPSVFLLVRHGPAARKMAHPVRAVPGARRVSALFAATRCSTGTPGSCT